MKPLLGALAGLWLLGQAPGPLAEHHFLDQVWKGCRAYHRGDYAGAQQAFRNALGVTPTSTIAHNDLGLSLYHDGKFTEAASEFDKALGDPDPATKARAAYNLGNARFKQNQLQEAADAYKQALRWNQKDDDARWNLQVVQEKLKQQPPDKKRNQDQKKDQQQKKKPDQQQQNKKQQQQSKNQDKNQQKQKPQDKKQNKEQQKKPDQARQPEPKKQPQKQPAATPSTPSDGMSRQDAERILRYFKDKEKGANVRLQNRQYQPPPNQEPW